VVMVGDHGWWSWLVGDHEVDGYLTTQPTPLLTQYLTLGNPYQV
jgi:hypothetical protein